MCTFWSCCCKKTLPPKKGPIPSSSATTRRDFRTRRDFFAVFEHGNGLKYRLVVADEDGKSCERKLQTALVSLKFIFKSQIVMYLWSDSFLLLKRERMCQIGCEVNSTWLQT